jgi:hypothetical protein
MKPFQQTTIKRFNKGFWSESGAPANAISKRKATKKILMWVTAITGA